MVPWGYRRHPYHHCGPFNSVLDSSSNEVDSACRDHDIAYGKMGSKAYFRYSKADEDFVERMDSASGIRPRVYAAVFRAKKLVAPAFSQENAGSDMARYNLRTRRPHYYPPTPAGTQRPRGRSVTRTPSAVRPMSIAARPVHRLMAPRSSGPTSSGRFTARSGRRFRRRQRRLFRTQNRGLLQTVETGISTVSGTSDMLYIGHCNFPIYTIRYHMYRVIIKTMAMQILRINIESFIAAHDLPVGDTILLDYKANYDTACPITTVTYTSVLADTWETIAAAFEAAIGEGSRDLHFINISYVSTLATISSPKMPLQGAKIYLNLKSSFKLQNQSASDGGDEADDVDNIPIYGKLYEGIGCGTNSYRAGNVETSFVCHDNNGTFAKIGGPTTGLSETPPPGYFQNVRRSASAHLTPGQLKTSVLTTVKWVNLESLCRNVFGFTSNAYDMGKMGRFRFFAFEHMLKYAASTPNIKVTAEHNLRIAMKMSIRRSYVTDELISNGFVTY